MLQVAKLRDNAVRRATVRRIFGERVGLIPYQRCKSYLCVYRLAIPVMLLAMLTLIMIQMQRRSRPMHASSP